jgi:type II secretory pathway pseudopilin PulG
MSGAEPALIAAFAAAGSTAASVVQGQQQMRAQKRASRQAARQAESAQRQAQREFNAANQKAPDIAALMKRNRAMGSGGISGTYLTGAGGVSPRPGMLGRTTLLGS